MICTCGHLKDFHIQPDYWNNNPGSLIQKFKLSFCGCYPCRCLHFVGMSK